MNRPPSIHQRRPRGREGRRRRRIQSMPRRGCAHKIRCREDDKQKRRARGRGEREAAVPARRVWRRKQNADAPPPPPLPRRPPPQSSKSFMATHTRENGCTSRRRGAHNGKEREGTETRAERRKGRCAEERERERERGAGPGMVLAPQKGMKTRKWICITSHIRHRRRPGIAIALFVSCWLCFAFFSSLLAAPAPRSPSHFFFPPPPAAPAAAPPAAVATSPPSSPPAGGMRAFTASMILASMASSSGLWSWGCDCVLTHGRWCVSMSYVSRPHVIQSAPHTHRLANAAHPSPCQNATHVIIT